MENKIPNDINDNVAENVNGGKFDDEPVLVCHFCGKKYPMDKVVMCPFGACCGECRLKGNK